MKAYFHLFVVFLLVVASVQVNAQKSGSFKNKHKPIRVSPQKAKVICPIFEESAYPYHGFGVKVGDPVAFTYKLYYVKKLSFVLDVGSASSALYSNHHRDDFDSYNDEIIPPSDYPANNEFNPIYVQHNVTSEYVVEGKVLYQMQADAFYKGLQAYVGLGWQYRTLGIQYDYYYLYPNSNERGKEVLTQERLSQGPEIVGGIEYSYFKIPVAAFIEVTMYRDVIYQSGWTRFQGGVGLRYIF